MPFIYTHHLCPYTMLNSCIYIVLYLLLFIEYILERIVTFIQNLIILVQLIHPKSFYHYVILLRIMILF